MKRAILLREYSNAKQFTAPDGVVTVTVDPETGMPATGACPVKAPEVFIAGTEPVGACSLHGGRGDQTVVSSWDTPASSPNPAGKGHADPASDQRRSSSAAPAPMPYQTQPPKKEDDPKKKGILGTLKGIFK